MWTRKNKTRLWEWEYTIQKPMANDVVMRNWLFVSIQNWYIVPATSQTVIEWCAINDRYSGENNEHRYCIYQPRRDRETFTMEVENGTLKQEDVGKTFRIIWVDQHINYSTKADFGGQFRLEEVLNDNLWTFTYNKEAQFAPQGPQGNDWETPELEMGTVTKLQPDQNPTAELVKNGNTYTINLWIPAWAQGPKWNPGDKWDKGNPWNPGQDWNDWNDGSDWNDGDNWISPHYEWDWNGGTTYTKLAIVRYPDTNNVYRTWITETDSLGEIPGVSSNWKKMNRDGETGPQGDQGSVIAIPVEWKPGKDWIGINWKDGNPWISPHDEWIRDPTKQYSKLSMVRAFTGEYDQRGNEVRWYYVTENWAYQDAPQDWAPRQLVAKDGQAGEWNNYTVMVWLNQWLDRDDYIFNANANLDPEFIIRDSYTGNRDMISNTKTGLVITRTWHYRVFWHVIIQANTSTDRYINLWRFSIYLSTARTGTKQAIFVGTSKQWGPDAQARDTGPWIDLHIDIQLDLYEWDMLFWMIRLQSDDTNSVWNRWHYRIIGANDASWDDPDGQYIGWLFPTYMWVEYISAHLWNESDPQKLVWAL